MELKARMGGRASRAIQEKGERRGYHWPLLPAIRAYAANHIKVSCLRHQLRRLDVYMDCPGIHTTRWLDRLLCSTLQCLEHSILDGQRILSGSMRWKQCGQTFCSSFLHRVRCLLRLLCLLLCGTVLGMSQQQK